MAKHSWIPAKATDGQNEFQAFLCKNDGCSYLVVAYPPLHKESEHDPRHRLILIKAKEITLKDVEKYTRQYKVYECESSENGAERLLFFHTLDTKSEHSTERLLYFRTLNSKLST